MVYTLRIVSYEPNYFSLTLGVNIGSCLTISCHTKVSHILILKHTVIFVGLLHGEKVCSMFNLNKQVLDIALCSGQETSTCKFGYIYRHLKVYR